MLPKVLYFGGIRPGWLSPPADFAAAAASKASVPVQANLVGFWALIDQAMSASSGIVGFMTLNFAISARVAEFCQIKCIISN
ncbi:hypothetical protein KDC22_03985 [Paenibacillus tritici]|uniref:hypothetical protein n=1 Tax=Paenibacillus tritici TaxID=1873425 RepID=UPI001BA95ECC|nr:hypothetical protein [Paenibacillus tritici]QUL55739.1 hypothetical protein KDC22_03985 [Paenibacillus tritici]